MTPLAHETCVPRLRSLPFGARLGLTALLAVFAIGYVASVAHLYLHYENRDERRGLTTTDLVAAYHGVNVPSPLLESLRGGHPEDLPAEVRAALVAWLEGSRVNQDYDNLELGELAPSELMAVHCLSCHSRSSADQAAAAIPLENWDQVRRLAFSTDLSPTPVPVLVASTHAHALTLAAVGAVLVLLLAATGWARPIVSVVAFLLGAGLLLDIGGWWAARAQEAAVYAIIGGGAIFNGASALALLLVLADLWRPGGRT